MGSQLSQLSPPKPTFTEESISSQKGKVFIVTGASSGVGKELAQILFSRDAKVYVATRSEERASEAIDSIKAAVPDSQGSLVFLKLDLDDLTTIKSSAEEFLAKEQRLDVLWNNAGVMFPPDGSKTAQDYELQLGTNCVGPFLFTKLLTPVLISTAKTAPEGSVRVVWVSSSGAEMSPTNGVEFDNLDYKEAKSTYQKYFISKAGNVLHALEFENRYKKDGVISVALNPGNLKSGLQRHTPSWQMLFFKVLLHPPIHGAYTELFAGLSPDVPSRKEEDWIVPWGRFLPLRADLVAAGKTEAEGGTGGALRFWEWSEEQVKRYL